MGLPIGNSQNARDHAPLKLPRISRLHHIPLCWDQIPVHLSELFLTYLDFT